MILADFLPPHPDARWQYAAQLGVQAAIVKLNPILTGQNPPWDYEVLASAQKRFHEYGFSLAGLEGDQMPMDRIKLGLAGRDEDLEQYKKMVRNMGRLGIGLLCYNFMGGIGWFRTRTDLRERGGALVSGFSQKEAQQASRTGFGEVDEARMWENYRYFLEAILPVAEESGVRLALHPDDPPVSPLRGIGRILTSAEAFRRVFSLSASPFHGMTFCQGSFRAMGEDLTSIVKEFGRAGRVFFLHFRDITGDREAFRETFHDNGPTDMAAMIRLYGELNLEVPIRIDHVPTLYGEENQEPGYGALGRLYAIGYLRGLAEAAGIPLAAISSQ